MHKNCVLPSTPVTFNVLPILCKLDTFSSAGSVIFFFIEHKSILHYNYFFYWSLRRQQEWTKKKSYTERAFSVRCGD